jgi:fluoride exporter
MFIKTLLLIGTGSFIGGILRYLITAPFMHKYPAGFPWGTWIVNILGCLMIGILYGYAERWSFPKEWRMFLAFGVLGGFTTFSSFSNETVTLFQNGAYGYAITYVLSSVLLGIGATLLGWSLIKGW